MHRAHQWQHSQGRQWWAWGRWCWCCCSPALWSPGSWTGCCTPGSWSWRTPASGWEGGRWSWLSVLSLSEVSLWDNLRTSCPVSAVLSCCGQIRSGDLTEWDETPGRLWDQERWSGSSGQDQDTKILEKINQPFPVLWEYENKIWINWLGYNTILPFFLFSLHFLNL